MLLKITALPGDGIGPEVTEEGLRVLQSVADVFGHQVNVIRKDVGGAALVKSNLPVGSIPVIRA